MPPVIVPPAALVPTATALDPRSAAYCVADGPEVFSGIVHGCQIWAPDPFDVEAVHQEARAAFHRALVRASGVELPSHGRSLLLLGEGGSGKTHLMRAFRTAAHADGAGYCGYLQMLSRSDNYARYILSYLIDSLEQPYRSGDPTTGLARLARGLLDALTVIPEAERRKLSDELLKPEEIVSLVFKFADIAVQEFRGVDGNLLRAMLFLIPDDGIIRPKVMSWLRCEDLAPHDRAALGGLVPRCGSEMPLRMITDLGRLIQAVHSAALVLFVDQMEEMVELARGDAHPGELFRSAINTLIDISDALPNAVVVVGCLEDMFQKARAHLPQPKLDRLEHDPDPIRLVSNRSAEEVHAILSRRLDVFFDAKRIESDPSNPIAPYNAADLAPLTNLRMRAVLDFFRQHREGCVKAGKWVSLGGVAPPPPPPPQSNIAQQWNDFLVTVKPPIVSEEQLAQLLAWAVTATSDEMPHDVTFSTDSDERYVRVEVQSGNAADKLLVAVCDKSAKGGGLGKQIDEVVTQAGEIPAVFLRSTDFPKTPTADIAKRLGKLCRPAGHHRKIVVANGDWRAMTAFREFARTHHMQPGFREWRKSDRPLAGLPSLRKILDLDALEAAGPAKPHPPTPPLPPAGKAKGTSMPVAPTPTHTPPTNPVRFGETRGASPVAVELLPASLCRHAAFLGGSGSGKTTTALAIIEQLLLAGIPVVMLDRKGDLARYADPTAWVTPESDPQRASRRDQLRAAVDVSLYTPGADRGCPIAISVVPADLAQVSAAEREQTAQFAAAGLSVMMGYKSRTPDPKSVILQKAIEVLATCGQLVTAKALQKLVADQDPALVNVFGGQYDAKHFKALATDLLTLSIQHRRLLEDGQPLDIDTLLGRGAAQGKTRLTVISTQFLGDAGTTDFWVSQFLLAVDRWRAKNPSPDGRLQAVFLFDEADLYLPAVGKPATKGPMESLLKRARSAGIGLFLATQSPGDFDYRCRDQVLTWLIGRVKEPVAISKLKPMLEGRPGAADKLAEQKAGEFFIVRESDVSPIRTDRNLIPTEQLSEDRILEVARLGLPPG